MTNQRIRGYWSKDSSICLYIFGIRVLEVFRIIFSSRKEEMELAFAEHGTKEEISIALVTVEKGSTLTKWFCTKWASYEEPPGKSITPLPNFLSLLTNILSLPIIVSQLWVIT